MEDLDIAYEDNVDAWAKGLNELGRVVLPRVLARMLNNGAAQTRNKLKEYTEKVIDKPNAFTKRAWSYVQAKPADGDDMKVTIQANPKQAQYLWWLVFGGMREPGDAGTNPKFGDMFASAEKLSRYGGVDLKYVKRLMKKVKEERAQRSAYRERRKMLSSTVMPAAEKQAAMEQLKWNFVSKNKPGVFIGTIHGIKGVWERPQRMKAKQRQRVIKKARKERGDAWDEHFGGATKYKTQGLGWTKPGSQAKLLVAMARETKYKPTFDFFGVTQAAMSEQMTAENFAQLLNTEMTSAKKLRSDGLSDEAIVSRTLNNSAGYRK